MDYSAEPLPNGGQANLGHTGGTPAATASLPDLNGDTLIDGIDLLAISVAFGTAAGDPRYDLRSDLNRDGWVDGLDLSFVGSAFGGACE